MNAIRPNQLSAYERLDEIAEILALGVMRLRARQSTRLSPGPGDSLLDCPGNPSSHANALTNGALK